MLVSLEDLESRLPIQISDDQKARVETLLDDAEEIIRDAFSRVGRDFDAEASASPWLNHAAKRVIRDMVSAAVIIGPNVGQAAASSSTGSESDSVTFGTDAMKVVGFGRLILTDEHREELGLPVTALASGSFPPPSRWPERWSR